MTGCLPDDVVLKLVLHQLAGDDVARVHAHLEGCADCRGLVAEAARLLFDPGAGPADAGTQGTQGAGQSPPRLLAPGTLVSRYVLGPPIGAGSGGVVYRAHDPELGRTVAVKLVRGPPGGETTDGQTRVAAEAAALARLSHPNVVNVHDAGRFEDQVFLVMELVEGATLSRWLRESPRSWRDVVGVMADAAQGLTAAHRAGLVHRDVKPDNVMVGTDGRARVTDFGLAEVQAASAADEVATDTATVPGTRLAGTPAYMAPEIFAGRPADARSDQFSFCVTLYQALTGQHPFDAGAGPPSVGQWARAISSGARRPPPPPELVPPPLYAVITRGLSPAPQDRHGSMDDVQRALREALGTEGKAGVRRGRIGIALALAIAVAGVVLAARRPQVRQSEEDRGAAAARCGNGKVDPGEECDPTGAASAGCTGGCVRCTGGDARYVWPENGHCYTRHDGPVPWAEADAACRKAGAHLAADTVAAEMAAVGQHLFGPGTPAAWIGLLDPRGTSEFYWVTGETNFDLPYQAKQTGRGGCVVQLAGAVSGPRALEIRPCSQPMPFICEKSAWTEWRGNGHAYREVAAEKTLEEAMGACKALGAHLLTISSEAENQFTARFYGEVWLAARKTAAEPNFRWLTDEAFAFHPFAPGEPDRKGYSSNCVVRGTAQLWHDRPCDAEGGPASFYNVVCEAE